MPNPYRLNNLPWLPLVLLFATSFASGAEKPNIVFILTDDQAPWAMSGEGALPGVKTPNLERLASEGARLVNAFTTTPVCSPSRASLMTSRYGSELGITEWLNHRVEPNAGLDPALATFPELLQKAGYKTGLVGKWHLGQLDKFHPTQTGFDYFFGFRGGGAPPVNPKLESQGEEKKFEGFTPDILTDHAIEFIDQNKSDPFLLCLHFRAPHARWLPVAEEDWAPFESLDVTPPQPDYPNLDTARVKRMTREYLASVHSVDRNVGRLLRVLDDLGLAATTAVIFTSDHGYNMGHNGIWHKGNGHWVLTDPPPATKNIPKGQRPNMYDHSIRVPTIIRYPNTAKKGDVITQTVSNLDWFPTLLKIAGVDPPGDLLLRGRDITPILKREPVQWDNDFYAEYSTRHQSHTHMRMYRTPQWKLIRDYLNQGRDELYNLDDDAAETTNLIDADTPEVKAAIADLDAKLRQRMKENKDQVAQDGAKK